MSKAKMIGYFKPATPNNRAWRPKNSAKNNQKKCDYCRGTEYTEKPFKVITQRGKEVEVKFNFCPNCGKMLKKVGDK